MDANRTRFHLLLDYPDWSACQDSDLGISLDQAWNSSPPAPESPVGAHSHLAWDSGRKELTLQPLLFKFRASPKDNPPSLDDRRGAACDRFGNWYWIDSSRQQVLVNSSGSGAITLFWPVPGQELPADRTGSFRPRDPSPAPIIQIFSGLAVTTDQSLVVGMVQPAGLLVFDLHAGGAPQTLNWPGNVAFAPFDLSPRPGGGIWILDRQNRRLWGLDRHLNPVGPATAPTDVDAFQPINAGVAHFSAVPGFATGFSLELSSPVAAGDPVAVETLPDDSVLILDRAPGECFSMVARYCCNSNPGIMQLAGQPVSLEIVTSLVDVPEGETFCLHGHDLGFIPEHTSADGEQLPDRLYVASSEGNQAFTFDITLSGDGSLVLKPVGEFYPMRLFGGSGLAASGIQLYYDFATGKGLPVRWVPLVAQPRPRFTETGMLETPICTDGAPELRSAFDGRVPSCTWHRLDLDGSIPPETSLVVWSRSADTQSELAGRQWQPEPRPYLRRDGSEQPYVVGSGGSSRSPSTASRASAGRGAGTWELLLQHAHGRYLQLRLQLTGNGRTTPRLRSLRVYYPRFSYLTHYLPATYQADALSADFLDRFLANFEGFFTAIEDRVANAQSLFDIRTVPSDALEWLAGFYGILYDPSWNKAQQWLLLKYAMPIFQYRGTVRGLQALLYLALNPLPDEDVISSAFSGNPSSSTDLCGIRIVERFRARQAPAVLFGDPTTVGTSLGGGVASTRPFKPPSDWQVAPGEIGYITSVAPAGVEDASAQASRAAVQSAWQGFLLRRYRQVRQLNRSHASSWDSFKSIPLPEFLPSIGSLTRDFYLFQTAVLGMYRTAHRFTVLLPASPDLAADSPEQQRRVELIKRIVDLEKPAHTIFDVRFYWAMFRIGEARLGQDTLLDLGSRNPQLMPGMILGQGHLSEGALAPGHPQNVRDRSVLGRDHLSNTGGFS